MGPLPSVSPLLVVTKKETFNMAVGRAHCPPVVWRAAARPALQPIRMWMSVYTMSVMCPRRGEERRGEDVLTLGDFDSSVNTR